MDIDLEQLLKKYFLDGEITEDGRYLFNIFTEKNDEFLIQKIKKQILKLKKYELIIFLLYVELGTYLETAKVIGVSPNTIRSRILKIKKDIIEKIKEDKC